MACHGIGFHHKIGSLSGVPRSDSQFCWTKEMQSLLAGMLIKDKSVTAGRGV